MSVTADLTALSAEEIQSCRADPTVLDHILEDRSRLRCALDKAWAGLQFLFAAGDYHLEAAMLDIERAEQLGAYSVCIISPQTMTKLADNFDWEGRADHLATFYRPEQMSGVYPDIWVRNGAAALKYLLSFIPALRTFTDDAANRRMGAVVVIG